MPKMVFTLEQQLSDLRSNEQAYLFRAENQGPNPIEILVVTPRIPEKVELLEVKSPSISAARSKYDELCKQLTELVKDFIIGDSREIRERLAQNDADQINLMLGSLSNIARMYFAMLTGSVKKNMEAVRRRSNALFVQIENKHDADNARSTFLSALSDDDIRKKVFDVKIEQLAAYEAAIGAGQSSKSLATVQPDSFFAVTYILRFPRSTTSPKKYNVTIEAGYSEEGKSEKYVGSSTTSLIISPRPLILSLIAIMASLLGTILRIAVEQMHPTTPSGGFKQLFGAPEVWHGVAAAITALVFFNVYEFTALGDKFKMSVSWSSALLIGLLCGLSEDRILAALKAFIGT